MYCRDMYVREWENGAWSQNDRGPNTTGQRPNLTTGTNLPQGAAEAVARWLAGGGAAWGLVPAGIRAAWRVEQQLRAVVMAWKCRPSRLLELDVQPRARL